MNIIQNKVMALSAKVEPIKCDYFDELLCEVEANALDYCSYNSSYVCDGKRIKVGYDDLMNVSVIEQVEEFLVMRVFQIRVHLKSCLSFMKYQMSEVAQRWTNKDGESVCLMKRYWRKSYGMFNLKSKFRIVDSIPDIISENWYFSFNRVSFRIKDFDFMHLYKLLKGFTFNEAKVVCSEVGEFLYKCGYNNLFNKCIKDSVLFGKCIEYFKSIKIAHRHKFDFTKDLSIWIDTLDAIKMCNGDLHNPKFVCPTELKDVHDIFIKKRKKVEEMEAKEYRIKKALENEERYYNAHKPYLGIVFGDDVNNLHFTVIQNAVEMIEEGKQMHHCVVNYVEKDMSLILSCKDDAGNRIATIEINLNTFEIVQTRGLSNKEPEKYNEINATIERNICLIKNAKTQYDKMSIAA